MRCDTQKAICFCPVPFSLDAPGIGAPPFVMLSRPSRPSQTPVRPSRLGQFSRHRRPCEQRLPFLSSPVIGVGLAVIGRQVADQRGLLVWQFSSLTLLPPANERRLPATWMRQPVPLLAASAGVVASRCQTRRSQVEPNRTWIRPTQSNSVLLAFPLLGSRRLRRAPLPGSVHIKDSNDRPLWMRGWRRWTVVDLQPHISDC